uniref:DNA-directed DNA polymerase n=1 Tax=Steinernema glaseri TaxID=37863 RepID=A0A1I8ASI3_9BILA
MSSTSSSTSVSGRPAYRPSGLRKRRAPTSLPKRIEQAGPQNRKRFRSVRPQQSQVEGEEEEDIPLTHPHVQNDVSTPSTSAKQVNPFQEIEGIQTLTFTDDKHKKFLAVVEHLTFVLKKNDNPAELFEKVVTSLIDNIYGRYPNPENKFGFSFSIGKLTKPIYVSLNTREFNTAPVLLRRIEQQAQSAGRERLEDSMELTATIMEPPTGKGHRNKNLCLGPVDPNSKVVYKIYNEDSLCMARAIAVGKLLADREAVKLVQKGTLNKPYNNLSHQITYILTHEGKQKKAALKVLRDARVPTDLDAYGLKHLEDIQRSLTPRYKIHLVKLGSIENNNNNPISWHVPEVTVGKPIYLLRTVIKMPDGTDQGHYDAVSSISALREASYCKGCMKIYTINGDHNCGKKCFRCEVDLEVIGSKGYCTPDGSSTKCQECLYVFESAGCYARHKQLRAGARKNTVCDEKKFCDRCQKSYTVKNTNHRCLRQSYCPLCQLNVDEEHHDCFLKSESAKTVEKLKRASELGRKLYFDVETIQNVFRPDSEEELEYLDKHYVNLIVVHRECPKCEDTPLGRDCEVCGPRRRVFKYKDSEKDPKVTHNRLMYEFVGYLLHKAQQNLTCIAHYGSGFDFTFVLAALLTELDPAAVTVICNGNKITELTVKSHKLRFVDSLNFLYAPLADLPKTFGFADIVEKGHFPFYRNVPELYGETLQCLPDKREYGYTHMTLRRQKEFDEWYVPNLNKPWSFNEIIERYCEDDVKVLRLACRKFSKIFMEISGVFDPFVACSTIAGTVMKHFKINHFRPQTLVHTSEPGVYDGTPQSKLALQYLEYLIQKKDIPIRHKLNGGEYRIETREHKYRVDGYVAEGKKVYEVLGCWWHGHSCANNPQDVILNPADQKAVEKANIVRLLMGERQARTQARKKDIEAAGYTVFDIWECDINRERRENNELDTFMNEVDVSENFLMPRKAFFGGRTGLCQAIYETDLRAKEPEYMYYYDVSFNAIVNIVQLLFLGDLSVPLHLQAWVVPYRQSACQKRQTRCYSTSNDA